MKYKVGDKVRVSETTPLYMKNHCVSAFVPDTLKYNGRVVTINEAKDNLYKIEEDKGFYDWYEDMIEPVEEMRAEEAFRLQAEMCINNPTCSNCPVGKLKKESGSKCNEFQAKHPEEVLEAIKQWKADHEKKLIETENVMYIVVMDEKRNAVYEEKTNEAIITSSMKEEVLKKYCLEHDGKYYAIGERRCVVKG